MIALAVFAFLCFLSPALAEHLGRDDKSTARSVLRAIDATRPKTAAASLEKIKDPLLRKALTWMMYLETPQQTSFGEIAAFIQANPGWPRLSRLQKRAEERMTGDMPPETVMAWFDGRDPVSTEGWTRLGAALLALGDTEKATAVFRRTWVSGNFTKSQERQFYRAYRRYLTREDHIDRLERLLWKGSYWPTRRMFGKVNEDLRRLAEARFLLRHMRGNVDKAIQRVPEELRNHPGLVYERLRWRRKKGKDGSARELLRMPDDESTIRPDLWFKERAILARRALSEGLITEAYRLVEEHYVSEDDAASFSDAEWMAGWIALRYLNEPEWAYQHFTAMYEAVGYPISVSRGAYWSGLAAEAMGQHKLSQTWFRNAARFFTTFYGQLAATRLEEGAKAIELPELPEISAEDTARFKANELVAVTNALAEVGAEDRLRPFILHLFDVDESLSWALQTAALARSLGRPDLAIRVAKLAERRGQYIPDAGYPLLSAPDLPNKANGSDVEPALVLALIRQESAFYPEARSGAGARGMMQLMPATAKRVAKQVGMRYTKAKLNDPTYNMQIGQTYLSGLLKSFNGSYILSLSSYNAGPRRAKAWSRANGDLNDPEVDPVDWIESIPFNETRNYVQRVLENLQVYRALLDGENNGAIGLHEDLRRWEEQPE